MSVFRVALDAAGGLAGGAVSMFTGFSVRTWLLIGGAVAVAGVILLGYHNYTGLQDKLVKANADLAAEKVISQVATARGDDILDQHNRSTKRLEALEAERATVDEEVTNLRDQLRTLTGKDIEHDPQATVDAFRDRAARVNRLLEHYGRGSQAGDRGHKGK